MYQSFTIFQCLFSRHCQGIKRFVGKLVEKACRERSVCEKRQIIDKNDFSIEQWWITMSLKIWFTFFLRGWDTSIVNFSITISEVVLGNMLFKASSPTTVAWFALPLSHFMDKLSTLRLDFGIIFFFTIFGNSVVVGLFLQNFWTEKKLKKTTYLSIWPVMNIMQISSDLVNK